VNQWNATINGHNLPELPDAELKKIKEHDGNSSFSETTKALMAEVEENTFFQDSDKVTEEMKEFFWATEESHLINTVTFGFMTKLKSPNNADQVYAMFHIYGMVITAGKEGVVPVDEQAVHCYGCTKSLSFPKSSLFLAHQVGSRYITFDKPWTVQMGEGNSLFYDVHWKAEDGTKLHGMSVVYCFQYQVTGANEVQLLKAGIMFMQHLSMQNHFANLWAVANIMKDKMGELGAQLARLQQGGSMASSSSAPLSALLHHSK